MTLKNKHLRAFKLLYWSLYWDTTNGIVFSDRYFTSGLKTLLTGLHHRLCDHTDDNIEHPNVERVIE